MHNQVVFVDGSFRSADSLADFSFDLFQTFEHVDSCERLAAAKGFQGLEYKVAVNFLFLKSRQARKLSALRWLYSTNKSSIKTIFIDKSLWSEGLFPDTVEVNKFDTATRLCHVTWQQTAVFVLKLLSHLLFRLFRTKAFQLSIVTRAWVEVTESLYPDLHKSSHILIYPFPMNLMRQLRFMKRILLGKKAASLEGLPYSLKGLSLPFISAERRLREIVKLETSAYLRHADEIVGRGAKTLQTSDEFEVGSVALCSRLRERGIPSINTAHGVGNYGPFQSYSEFVVLNSAQSDFYRERNPEIVFRIRTETNSIPAGTKTRNQHATIVFIHQNFRDLGLTFEDRLQLKIIGKLKEAALLFGINFVVKLHPNAATRNIDEIRKCTGVTVARYISFDTIRPIFFTLNSTAYFDFRHLGPVLFYIDGSMRPETYFGNEIQTVTEAGLQNSIQQYLSGN